MTTPMALLISRYGHFQRQQWGYYATADGGGKGATVMIQPSMNGKRNGRSCGSIALEVYQFLFASCRVVHSGGGARVLTPDTAIDKSRKEMADGVAKPPDRLL